MKSGRNDVVSTSHVGVVVSTRFSNVDLTRLGPNTICVVDWQHPNCGPEPVTSREGSFNFDSSILDGCSDFGVDTSRSDRLDNCSGSAVGNRDTVSKDSRCAGTVGSEIDDTVRFDEGGILECGSDDQFAILDKNVLVIHSSLLEFTIAAGCQ